VSAPDWLKKENFGKAERHRCAVSGNKGCETSERHSENGRESWPREGQSSQETALLVQRWSALLSLPHKGLAPIQVTFRQFLVDFIPDTSEICNTA
jgi:hypothetical protein